MRKADAPGVVVRGDVHDNTWRIDIGRRSDTGEPLTGIDFDAPWLDPSGQLHPAAVVEVGLGRYRASVPLGHHEHVALRLHDRTHDKVKVMHYRRPYPPEYRLSDRLPPPPLASLRAFEAEAVREGVPPLPRREPVTHLAYFAALACMLVGLLLRRV